MLSWLYKVEKIRAIKGGYKRKVLSQLNVILPLQINETNYCQCKNSQEAARLASLLPGICFVGVTLPICCASGPAFAFLFL